MLQQRFKKKSLLKEETPQIVRRKNGILNKNDRLNLLDTNISKNCDQNFMVITSFV